MRALTILSTSAILLSSIFSYNLHAAEHEIKMLNSGKDGSMVFEPGTIKVEVGDTVKFIATDAGHNSQSIFSPEGVTAWKGEIGKDITEILEITNKKILKDNFELSNSDIELADRIWKKLSKRRLNRGKKT